MMETRANYFFVGLFVLALVAGTFVLVMWLGRSGLQDDRTSYYIYVRGSVTGLQNGAPVQYRGVPVGTVTDIAIDAENLELIQVTVAIKAGTPIKTDTVATLQLQGITGLSFVQLSGGTRDAPPLEPPAGKRRARIAYKPSPLEKIVEDVPEAIGQVVALAGRANDLLSDDNLAAITSIIGNVDLLATTVGESRAEIKRAVANAAGTMEAAQKTAAAMETLANELRTVAADLGKDARTATRTAEETARGFSRLASELQSIAGEFRTPLRDFSEAGFHELSQLLIDTRALVTSLNRIAIQFERDPARFLFGDQQKGFEAR
ncbi:MAG: MCE family protein [Alphaproteobacteria bacterium]|nr:MCE family protein [Alphaproteobacteria bacterium]